ncbi:MAG: hypothetical protein KGI59_00185 [Patescibacteria group bacterium]|nr:hypothetical protein [Patescibacteria group bacterium]
MYGFLAARGAGKSTLSKKVADACNHVSHQPLVTAFDSSAAIDWCRRNLEPTAMIRQMIKQQEHQEKSGGIYNPMVAVACVRMYIVEIVTTPIVMVAGFPRTMRQSTLWNQGGRHRLQIIDLECTKEQMFAGVWQRQMKTGVVRPEETAEGLERAWQIMLEHRHSIHEHYGDHVLQLKRADSIDDFISNVRRTVQWMTLQPLLKGDILDYISSQEFHRDVDRDIFKCPDVPQTALTTAQPMAATFFAPA